MMAEDFESFYKQAKQPPKDDFESFYSRAKSKPAAPVKEEPVYDIMGSATGYTQPAQPGPSQAVREFERTEGPFGYAKEYGKGATAFLAGTPAELTINLPSNIEALGRLGLRAAGANVSADTAIPRVGYGIPEASKYLFGEPKSDIARGMRTAGEVLGAPSPFGAYAALRPGLTISGKVARAAEDIGIATERLAEKGESAAKRFAKQPTEISQIQTLAREESKLASPDSIKMFESGTDAESTARKLAEAKGAAAERKLEQIGGGAFENYKNIASEKQQVQPLGLSPQGKQLQNQLETVISGGEGPLKIYGQKEINIAKDIYKEIFGRRGSDISPKEIEAVSSRLPQFGSQSAREIQAKNLILEREGRRPVDFKVVDNLLRELRQIEQSKDPQAATKIARERYASAGDMVENALKNWVGEDVYPREIYREAAKDKNAWQTRLGEVLRAKREIPYSAKTAEYEKPEVLGTLFESRSSTNFTKELLGEAETNALAERYAMNELEKLKTPEQIEKWRKDNQFIYEIPGLSNKLETYQSSIARRAEESTAVTALKKEAAGIPKALKDFEKSMDDPAKALEKWSGVREKLENTKLYSPEELDRVTQQITDIAKIADKKQRREDLAAVITKLGLKYGLGGTGAYYGAKSIFDLLRGD